MSLYFSGTDEMVRLDQSDAKFVEVIHSNSDILTNLGLGMSEAIGHVDLYPVKIYSLKNMLKRLTNLYNWLDMLLFRMVDLNNQDVRTL